MFLEMQKKTLVLTTLDILKFCFQKLIANIACFHISNNSDKKNIVQNVETDIFKVNFQMK